MSRSRRHGGCVLGDPLGRDILVHVAERMCGARSQSRTRALSDWWQRRVPRRHRAAATSRGYAEDFSFGIGTRIPGAVAPLAPATANNCVEPS
jgi:hypothetical protein